MLDLTPYHSHHALINYIQPSCRPFHLPSLTIPSQIDPEHFGNNSRHHIVSEYLYVHIASFVLSFKTLQLLTPFQTITHPLNTFCLQPLYIPACLPTRHVILPILTVFSQQTVLNFFNHFPFHCSATSLTHMLQVSSKSYPSIPSNASQAALILMPYTYIPQTLLQTTSQPPLSAQLHASSRFLFPVSTASLQLWLFVDDGMVLYKADISFVKGERKYLVLLTPALAVQVSVLIFILQSTDPKSFLALPFTLSNIHATTCDQIGEVQTPFCYTNSGIDSQSSMEDQCTPAPIPLSWIHTLH